MLALQCDQRWVDAVTTRDELAAVLLGGGGVCSARRRDTAHGAVRAILKQRPVLGIQHLLEEFETGPAIALRSDGVEHLTKRIRAKCDPLIRARRGDNKH